MDEFDLLGTGGRIISGLVLLPYFWWGIYTLQLRFRYHEDLSPRLESLTLLAVAIFYATETYLLHEFVGNNQVVFIFTMMGLAVASAALYGPMAISLLSQLLVDTIAPGERSKTHEPQFGPAEALEREGDYEGAVREYTVMARIFPRESAVHIRIAEACMQLSQHDEAGKWFERAMKCTEDPEMSLQLTNRLYEIYNRQLSRPDDARRVLEAYIEKYPDAEYAESVRGRLKRLMESTSQTLG